MGIRDLVRPLPEGGAFRLSSSYDLLEAPDYPNRFVVQSRWFSHRSRQTGWPCLIEDEDDDEDE